jgi:ADP-heptose:LPS heptosyltransferase
MRILIYRLGSLGDTVVALPCFHLIRQTYPTAHIAVLTNAPVSDKAAPLESILENTGLIDAAIHYPVGLRDPRKLLRLQSTIREQRFDLVISLAAARGLFASVRDYLFFKACGIPTVLGIPFRGLTLASQPVAQGSNFESEAERLLRRIDRVGSVDLNDNRWFNLRLTPGEVAEGKRLLAETGITGEFLVASFGTKLSLNDWGAENWQRLLAEASGLYPELPLVLLGSADEKNRSEALLESWRGPRAHFCGRTSPRSSAVILREASLFIGHDSGPMHLANAVGTRCITIFSAHGPPGQWFPSGPGHLNLYPYSFYDPARTNDLEYQRKAISTITVEQVLAAIRQCLD